MLRTLLSCESINIRTTKTFVLEQRKSSSLDCGQAFHHRILDAVLNSDRESAKERQPFSDQDAIDIVGSIGNQRP